MKKKMKEDKIIIKKPFVWNGYIPERVFSCYVLWL